MHECIVLLGSNIEPAKNIRLGAKLLGERQFIRRVSSVWETPPIGTIGAMFYNAAILMETTLTEEKIKLQVLRPIEEQMGRVRTQNKYAARTMDMDAIVLDNVVLDPRLFDTAFILLPTAELAPNLHHPVTGKTLKELAEALKPSSGARRLTDFPLLQKN